MQKSENLVLPNDYICDEAFLEDGGQGFRCLVRSCDVPEWLGSTLQRLKNHQPAFLIKFRQEIHAYLNRCAHIEMEMDWVAGNFFDKDQKYIVCATHDAHYLPDSGLCVSGPCPVGSHLIPLPIQLKQGKVYFISSD